MSAIRRTASGPDVVGLRRLTAWGRTRGYVPYEELQKALPDEVAGSPEELEKTYLRLEELGIEVSPDGGATGTGRRAKPGRTSAGPVERAADPLRVYLHELGSVELLDREGEVRIAKRIEEGEVRIYRALAENPLTLKELLRVVEVARRDPRAVTEIIRAPEAQEVGGPVTQRLAEILRCFRRIAAI